MDLIALLVLFASHYFVSFSNSATALECYAAVDGGQCRNISLRESKCHTRDRESNYLSMRKQCCHDDIQESCPSTPAPPSNDCSRMDFSTPSSPPFLNVTVLPIHCNSFTITATWPRSENVSFYTLAVYKRISSHHDVIQCYSTIEPETTSITLSPLCYDSRYSTLYVALWKVVAGQSVLIGHSSIKRKNCYSLYTDPVVRYNQCGPYNSELNSSAVRVRSVSSGKGEVNTTVSWPPVRGANSYEMQIKYYGTLPLYFNVTAATEVTFAGLNQSTYYSLRIKPYIECLGMYLEETSWQPCTATDIPSLDLSVATPSRVPSVTILTSSTITSTAQRPSITSSLLSPSHPPIPGPGSSQDHTTTVDYYAPTVGHTATVDHTSTVGHTDTEAGVSIAVTVVAVTVAVVVVAVVLGLLLSLLALLVYCKPHCAKTVTPVPQEELGISFPGHIPTDPYGSGYIESPLAGSAGVVLVLYSLRTSHQEQEKIHNSLSGLARYGLSVKTPGTIGPRDISREWLEVEMKQAKAVLLVCNDQFYEEWTDKCTAESDCRLQIGREVRVLKNGLEGIELRKFAYIYSEETDKDYSKLSSYIQTHFTLAGNTDPATTIHSIAQFVENVPDFVYIDTIKC